MGETAEWCDGNSVGLSSNPRVTSLSLNFPICKVDTIIPTSWKDFGGLNINNTCDNPWPVGISNKCFLFLPSFLLLQTPCNT